MNIKTRTQALLRIKGMTQKQLAEKLGISQVGLSQTLASQYPSTRTIEKIAKALGVEVEDIISTREVSEELVTVQKPEPQPQPQLKPLPLYSTPPPAPKPAPHFIALISFGNDICQCRSIQELQDFIDEYKLRNRIK